MKREPFRDLKPGDKIKLHMRNKVAKGTYLGIEDERAGTIVVEVLLDTMNTTRLQKRIVSAFWVTKDMHAS